MNKRRLGENYEEIAVNYLKNQGVKILHRNYRTALGEIDIIGEEKEYYLFVEVKYRKNADFGYPYEAVTYAKQKKICQVAKNFCYREKVKKAIRYDVISICNDKIDWYRNAFYHIGSF